MPRGQELGVHLGTTDAKEEKRGKSARFTKCQRTSSDAKEEERSKSARFKKSSEENGAKGLRKVLNTADTDAQEILPHRASVPRTSGPPEYRNVHGLYVYSGHT